MIVITNIIALLPLEIIYYIDKIIHKSYQTNINREVHMQVEKLEDAQEIDPSLTFYHLHNKKNCKNLPFLFPDSYKKQTYEWIYETYTECVYPEKNEYCNKRKIYSKAATFYINKRRHVSHWNRADHIFKLKPL